MIERDHPVDAIADLVTGRLDAAARVALETHLETCEECRNERDAALWMRKRLADGGKSPEIPEGLTARITAALDAEDAAATEAPANWVVSLFRRPALAFGILLLALAAVVIGLRLQSPTLPQLVAVDYREFKSEELNLEMLTTDGALLEEFFVHRGLDFETRVLDLAIMQFNLEGGRVHTLAERPAAAFAYRGPAGEYLLCQMYPGRIEDLPPGATLREHECIKFYVYRRGDLTMAFWREGSVICVLTSADMDSESLVQLAFAKAMKVMGEDPETHHL